VSVGEDVAVAGVTTLAVLNPGLALAIAALLLLTGILLLVLLWSRVLRGWRRFRAWRARRLAVV
jgi:high-affinity Fe2+/Pb2+ permease